VRPRADGEPPTVGAPDPLLERQYGKNGAAGGVYTIFTGGREGGFPYRMTGGSPMARKRTIDRRSGRVETAAPPTPEAIAEIAHHVEATSTRCSAAALSVALRVARMSDATAAPRARLLAREVTRQLATLEGEVQRFIASTRSA
jgi:hypothetical protein